MANRILLKIVELARDGMWPDIVELLNDNPSEVRGSSKVLSVLADHAGSIDCIKFALSLGATPNGTEPGQDGPIFVCILGGSVHGLQTFLELEALLEGGADPNLRGLSGLPPLHWAVYYHRLDHAQILLNFGADPYALTADGDTLMDIANSGSTAAQEFVERTSKSLSSKP